MPIPKRTSAGASSVSEVNAADAAKELDELAKMTMEKQRGDKSATGAGSGKQGKAAKGGKGQEGKLVSLLRPVIPSPTSRGSLSPWPPQIFQIEINQGLIFEFHDKKGDVHGNFRMREDEDPVDMQKLSVEEMMEQLKGHENEQLRLLAGRMFPRGFEGPVWGE